MISYRSPAAPGTGGTPTVLVARLSAVNDLELVEVPTPSPGPGEVLVKVGANTICGTDLRILRGEKTSFVQLPVVLGHETAGQVAEFGPGVRGYEIGAPVALLPVIPCRRCWHCQHNLENACANKHIMGHDMDGGLAEYVLVPAAAVDAGCLFVVRADLPSEALALAEPLACVVNGQRHCRVGVDDTVLIMGAGPIGLLHLQLALLAGARAVIVSQTTAERRAIAERLGATVTVDPRADDLGAIAEEVSGGVGIDCTIICFGEPQLVNQALRLSRIGGRVNIFAGLKGDGWAEVEANLIHYRQIVLTGSSDCRRSDYETALRLIASGRIDTAAMVTHRYPLSAVRTAIDMVPVGEAMKVAVLPSA